MVNQKTIESLRRSVELNGVDAFDEDAIRLLLISARDLCGTLPIFREIADFVAHPNRGKGSSIGSIHDTANFGCSTKESIEWT